MRARGFDGSMPVLVHEHRATSKEWALAAALPLGAALARLAGAVMGGFAA